MFEDTLLIIKADYLHKRKPVLLKLLQTGFQIQGHRKLLFSPEHAAEFYKDISEDKSFMLQVILLSKGNSEAFILAKEDAVNDLINTMICYFTTSIEMDKNVHVTKAAENVRREIAYIFPNYIHEPIPFLQEEKFRSNPVMAPLINELYSIIQAGADPNQSWKMKLAEWFRMSNKLLPRITNQCSSKPLIGYEEKSQQVNMRVPCIEPSSIAPKAKKKMAAAAAAKKGAIDLNRGLIDAAHGSTDRSQSQLSTSTADSSMMPSSSTCITCSGFDSLRTPPPKTFEDDNPCYRIYKPDMVKIRKSVTDLGDEPPPVCSYICEPYSLDASSVESVEMAEGIADTQGAEKDALVTDTDMMGEPEVGSGIADIQTGYDTTIEQLVTEQTDFDLSEMPAAAPSLLSPPPEGTAEDEDDIGEMSAPMDERTDVMGEEAAPVEVPVEEVIEEPAEPEVVEVPIEEPPAPVEEPPAPAEEPTEPEGEPPAVVEEPPAPVEEPPEPAEEPSAPVEEPPAPVEEPPAPAEEPPAPAEE